MVTAPQVRRATNSDLGTLAAVLCAAFENDPLYVWFMRPHDYVARLERHFRQEAAQYLDSAEAYLTEDRLGAALWRPAPGAQPSPLLQLLRATPEFLRLCGPRRVSRLWRLIRMTEARYPKAPHRYLYLVGVQPDGQGAGLGSALIRAGLEACDRDGIPAYLESSKERNVPLYERHGFRVVERLDLGRNAPSMWLMWRDPQ
jgi:ribosomal protein S18 acetylase RimI-like enzyme